MKKQILFGLVVGLWSLTSIVSAQTTRAHRGTASAPVGHNAKPFGENIVKPSSQLLFLTSETGKKIASNFPPLAGYLAGMGIQVQPNPSGAAPLTPHQVSGLMFQENIPCDAPAGALFNL